MGHRNVRRPISRGLNTQKMGFTPLRNVWNHIRAEFVAGVGQVKKPAVKFELAKGRRRQEIALH
jgi:hypothetical protein